MLFSISFSWFFGIKWLNIQPGAICYIFWFSSASFFQGVSVLSRHTLDFDVKKKGATSKSCSTQKTMMLCNKVRLDGRD